MRFYQDFPEAINEIRRDLKEMGISIHTKSVQNKDITDKPEFATFELQNYTYTVNQPNFRNIHLRSPEWAEKEFSERISGMPGNPGEAWVLRKNYWEPFLKDGRMDYTYPDRMWLTVKYAIGALKEDINTRRAFIPIFDPEIDNPEALDCRIPCSIGYWLNYRHGRLNMTYLLRSSDFGEHFNYDIYLADRLKCHIATELGVNPGSFTHWIGSLHVFQKDVKDVF